MIRIGTLCVLLAGCQASPVFTSDGVESLSDSGWQMLFDGADLDHWVGLGRADVPAGHWVIEGANLHKVKGTSAPTVAGNEPGYGGDLRTKERYLNFELCFEFKLSVGANSGVKYNVSETMSAAHGHRSAAIGFEFQVLDDANHPDAKAGQDGNRTLGSLYDIYPAAADKPPVGPGEWHAGCVLADGNRITHSLNGDSVLAYEVGSSDFNARLAASKFAAIENFAERRSGYVVLQDHFDDVWYRNIRIRRLKPSN